MTRALVFVYGLMAYALFLGVFVYMAGFLLGFGVAKDINDGRAIQNGAMLSFVINLALIAIFGIFHSVLARDSAKSLLLRFLPAAAERSTYVLQSSLCLVFAMWQWQPMTTTLWQADSLGAVAIYAVFALGGIIVVWSTFLIDHFELFGLRQIWTMWQAKQMPKPEFRAPALYRIVRHPMQLGVVMMLFATPDMTHGHLLFATGMTAYIFVGLFFEERTLLRLFGDQYVDYQHRVPMLFPRLGRPFQSRVE